MTGGALAIIDRLLKALIFVPVMVLVFWWLLSAALDKTLRPVEAFVGFFLFGIALFLGVVSIISGGWGFLGILGLIYIMLLVFACWEYIYLRRREEEYFLGQIETCQQTIARDPTNAAAFSFLGQAYLKLCRAEEAVEAFESALKLDPESRQDRSFLRTAQEARGNRPQQQGKSRPESSKR